MKEIKVLVGSISMLNLSPNVNENNNSFNVQVTVLPQINNFHKQPNPIAVFFLLALGQEEISKGQLFAQDNLTR